MSILTNNRDVNTLILSKLNFQDLGNVLLVNKEMSKYNNNVLWCNFWKDDPDFSLMEKVIKRPWKEFSLLFVKYLDMSYGVYDDAAFYAARDGNTDLSDFFQNWA